MLSNCLSRDLILPTWNLWFCTERQQTCSNTSRWLVEADVTDTQNVLSSYLLSHGFTQRARVSRTQTALSIQRRSRQMKRYLIMFGQDYAGEHIRLILTMTFLTMVNVLYIIILSANLNNFMTALSFSGPFCCDSETHSESETFIFDSWFSDHQSQTDITMADPDLEELECSARPTRASYRPKAERDKLEGLLMSWRSKVHSEDPGTALFPLEDILCSQDIVQLARIHVDSPYISSSASITDFLEQSDDWSSIYAAQVLAIITDYNSTLPSKHKKTRPPQVDETRPPQVDEPLAPAPNFASFCTVIRLNECPPSPKDVPEAPNFETMCNILRLSEPEPEPEPEPESPVPMSNKRKGTQFSEGSGPSRKRLKRVPLKELDPNSQL